MADKPKYETFITPAGEAIYPWITKADVEHDANGIFHVDVSVPVEVAQDLIAKLEVLEDVLDVGREAVQKGLEVGLELLLTGPGPQVPEPARNSDRDRGGDPGWCAGGFAGVARPHGGRAVTAALPPPRAEVPGRLEEGS